MKSSRDLTRTAGSPPTRHAVPSAPISAHPRVWSRSTGAAMTPTVVATLDRHFTTARPRFRSSGLHLELLRNPSWKSRLYFYLFPLFVFAHIPLQTFFDFNAVFIMIEIAKFPNPIAPGVPGSGHNWALGAAAYIACWASWIFGVFILYELVYSFSRRWRFKRPLIVPLYLSSPAFNFVSMTSYSNFCFMQHIRISAFPGMNPTAALPSNETSLRDALAETCYFYSQNLPTVALLLPRAGLSLALLLTFWSPEQLPGGLAFSDIDQSIGKRDGTFFDQNTGALSGYAKGVLAANAAWTAWRILVLLVSWMGLWVFSGHGCAGICGPRYRWEEEEAEKIQSMYVEKTEDAGDTLPWNWKECTRLRVQEAYDFCLTLRPPRKEASAGTAVPQTSFDGVEQVLAAVGLGTGAHQARRGMLSQELFDSPKDGNSRGPSPLPAPDVSSIIPRPAPVADPQPKAEGSALAKDAPLMKLPYPFAGFGAKKEDSESEKDQIPFPPSPGLPDEDHGEETHEEDFEEGQELEYETEEREPRTSEDPSSFSGHATNSLSSLGQPIPSRYPFQFRHPGRGGSASSNGSHALTHVTPQSKSTSTHSHSHTHSTQLSRASRSTGNAESSDSPMSFGGSSSGPSPVSGSGRGMPMPPRHPGSNGQRRQRSGTVPIPSSPSPVVGDAILFPHGRSRARSRPESVGTDISPEVLYESEAEIDEVVGVLDLSGSSDSKRGRTSPDSDEGSQEAREREDSVGLLSAAPSPKSSFGGIRHRPGSRSRPGSGYRSRHGSSGSGSGSRSGSNSRHNSNSNPSTSSISLGLGAGGVRERAQSLIQSVGTASRSSLDLVVGRRGRTQSAMRLEEYEEGSESSPYFSEDAMSNPENYTFGLPGSRRRGEGEGKESDKESAKHTSSSASVSASASGSASGSSPHRLREAPSVVSQAAPSVVSQAAPSERTVSTQHTQATQHPPASPTQPIPGRSTVTSPTGTQFLSLGGVGSEPDISTAAQSFVTAPATVGGQTESSGATPSSWGHMEHYMEGRDWKPV
ncbi:hypothetical protein EVG20_g8264 [Dentipellis fragilis]|uniref:Proteophosphoglycan ppg4 n=1 Tax=Dentipellis fragilis TaxID=205917 RepID=A0A4Y9YBB2_9AGAM|nr:hypothetical protein EVG20_g8264 [Dentipellis fragilis]